MVVSSRVSEMNALFEWKKNLSWEWIRWYFLHCLNAIQSNLLRSFFFGIIFTKWQSQRYKNQIYLILLKVPSINVWSVKPSRSIIFLFKSVMLSFCGTGSTVDVIMQMELSEYMADTCDVDKYIYSAKTVCVCVCGDLWGIHVWIHKCGCTFGGE